MSSIRKEYVLEAAKKSFSMFGYKATTMDQVAKIANVGKGTIYNFFINKEELFNEIIKEFIQEMKDQALVVITDDQPFHIKLPQALYRMLTHREEHQLTIKLMQEVNEMGTKEAKDAIKQTEQAIMDFIKKEINKALDKGEIKSCNPDITSFVMVKLYIALVIDWEKNHPPLSEKEVINLFALYLIEGLKQ